MSQLKSDWENVLDNMDPHVVIGDEALKYILHERGTQSEAFGSEVKHDLRALGDMTYRLLMSATDRYLDLDRLDRNRKAQTQGQEWEKSTTVALIAASLEKDAKRSGGYPASSTAPSAPKKPPPCIMFQTGECLKGSQCRCEHVKVSEAELEDPTARRSAF